MLICGFLSFLDKFTLTDVQLDLLEAFLNERDAVGVLPTAYGKSIIYFLAPLVSTILSPLEGMKSFPPNPMVLVVTPTISLIEDQLQRCDKLGLKAIKLDNYEEDMKYDLVYATPEAFLGNTYRNLLLSEHFKENVLGVVVDEAHLVVKW